MGKDIKVDKVPLRCFRPIERFVSGAGLTACSVTIIDYGNIGIIRRGGGFVATVIGRSYLPPSCSSVREIVNIPFDMRAFNTFLRRSDVPDDVKLPRNCTSYSKTTLPK